MELLADAPLQLLVVPLYLALDPVQVGRAGALGGAPRILSNQVQVVQGRVCEQVVQLEFPFPEQTR